jgi:hypothetical protein
MDFRTAIERAVARGGAAAREMKADLGPLRLRYCATCVSSQGTHKRIYRDVEEAEADARALTEQLGRPFVVYLCSSDNRHVGSKKSDRTS